MNRVKYYANSQYNYELIMQHTADSSSVLKLDHLRFLPIFAKNDFRIDHNKFWVFLDQLEYVRIKLILEKKLNIYHQ